MEIEVNFNGERIMLDLKQENSSRGDEFVRVMSAYYLDKGEQTFKEIPDALLESFYQAVDIEELYRNTELYGKFTRKIKVVNSGGRNEEI